MQETAIPTKGGKITISKWDYPERISSYKLGLSTMKYNDGFGEATYNVLHYWSSWRKGTFMTWIGNRIPLAIEIAEELKIGIGDTEGVMAFLKHRGLEDDLRQVPVYKTSKAEV